MAKPRRTSRTDRAREAFLTTLAQSCNVSQSCRAAGIGRTLAYQWRKDDPEFAAAWDEAEEEAADRLEQEAWRRAVDGIDKPVTFQGVITDTYKEHSDKLLEILLKAHRPEKYVERLRSEISGPGGAPIKLDMSSLTDEQLAALEALNASQAQP